VAPQKNENPFLEVSQFHLVDSNDMQTIQLNDEGITAQFVRIIFTSSSDFYGRQINQLQVIQEFLTYK